MLFSDPFGTLSEILKLTEKCWQTTNVKAAM
jgi:hypothetical protein